MKKNLRISIIALSLSLYICVPRQALAVFGIGENIALARILFTNVKQLIELKKILNTAGDTFDLIENVNRRIDEALDLLETINKAAEPGVFYKVKAITDLRALISDIYGQIPKNPDQKMHQIHDLTVAESLKMHNNLFDYATQLDQAGEKMKAEAQNASPGRAQKLAAQNQGALLQALAQTQRNQAQIMKILSQKLAIENQREKKRATGEAYKLNILKKGFSHFNDSYELATVR